MTDPTDPEVEDATIEPEYAVVEPIGAQVVERLRPAADLDRLAGSTIAFVWDALFKGDLVFAAMAEQLSREHPDVTWVPHEVFGDIHGAEEAAVVADLPNRLAEYRVDAAIVGVGA
jgi:hypothetical protein